MKVKLSNLDGSAGKGDIELSDDVFGLEPRADILHRVVTWQLENRRGIARATRERSDVARTGKKFGRQKGGGTARHGDRKAPVFIGGGKAHGARRREFDVSLNKKVRALGLKMALSAKARDGLIVVDSLELKDAKEPLYQDVYSMVVVGFTTPWLAVLYLVAQGALFLHLLHGVQSSFQTLGLKNGRFRAAIRWFGFAVAAAVFVGNVGIVAGVWAGLYPVPPQ